MKRKTAPVIEQPSEPREEEDETENTLEYNVNNYESQLRFSIGADSLFNT